MGSGLTSADLDGSTKPRDRHGRAIYRSQYLAFIDNYSVMFGQPPAEADLQRFVGTSPPTIHQSAPSPTRLI
jgi:hypothetical protein